MRKGFIALLLSFTCFVSSSGTAEEAKTVEKKFPENFDEGMVSFGIDCIRIELYKNHTFMYKFTGDCKGWGREIRGTWRKTKDATIELSATLHENKAEGMKGCAGSYYAAYSKKEQLKCYKKYRNHVKSELGVFPATCKIEGVIELPEPNSGTVNLSSTLVTKTKNPDAEPVPCLLKIDGDQFAGFQALY